MSEGGGSEHALEGLVNRGVSGKRGEGSVSMEGVCVCLTSHCSRTPSTPPKHGVQLC